MQIPQHHQIGGVGRGLKASSGPNPSRLDSNLELDSIILGVPFRSGIFWDPKWDPKWDPSKVKDMIRRRMPGLAWIQGRGAGNPR